MENEPIKPEEEYQASEQEHEIYQPEQGPEQRPSRSSTRPLMMLVGMVLLIILFYKLYLYFFASPQNQHPVKAMTATVAPNNVQTQTVAAIPAITPASTVSPAANVPNTQPAAAVTPSVPAQITLAQPPVTINQPQVSSTPSVTPSVANENAATTNATVVMQNSRLDTLEEGMNDNRTSIQNLQNQINSLASSVSSLQTGINNINNTLANIKNMQQQQTAQQTTQQTTQQITQQTTQQTAQQNPINSTIIKHYRRMGFRHFAGLQESSYLAQQPRVYTAQSPQVAGQVGGMQYFVKAMIQGRAWLVSADGTSTVTVSSGDYLPGYGLIEDINPNQGIITTSAGGIIQYNPADR